MYLKQIRTRNIQNHAEVVVDLPPTGLVVFAGPNSNGKSVIVRATRYLLSGLLAKPRKRAALVNRQAMYGEITYVRDDDTVLLVHVAREAASTYVSYKEPNMEQPVVRYLADKSYKELAYHFGFHYDPESGVSLNIGEEEEALLFYKTSHKTNGRLTTPAVTDISAQRALETFENLIKEARGLKDAYTRQLRIYSEAVSKMVIEDTNVLSTQIAEMMRVNENLKKIYIPELPEIKPVPVVKTVSIYKPSLPTVSYPRVYEWSCNLPDVSELALEIQEIENNRCPTCGRRLVDDSSGVVCNGHAQEV